MNDKCFMMQIGNFKPDENSILLGGLLLLIDESKIEETRKLLSQVSKYKVQKKKHKQKRINKKWLKRYGYIELPNKFEAFDIINNYIESSGLWENIINEKINQLVDIKDLKLGE